MNTTRRCGWALCGIGAAALAASAGCDRRESGQEAPRVAIAAIAPIAQAAPAQAPGRELTCYNRAQDETLLSEEEALELCSGAASLGPLVCYQAAQDRTLLGTREAIALCRCAASAAPVDCYERGQDDTFLEQRKLIAMCRPERAGGLVPGCRPLR